MVKPRKTSIFISSKFIPTQTEQFPPPPQERFRILSSSLLGMYSDWPATFNGHSLVIGRINYWPLVLTWMTRTCPSWPGNTSSTRPRCHWPRGAFWSTTSTTSPTFRFSLASLDFFRVLSVDRYSSLQRFQSTLTRFWISLQRFLGWNAMSSVTWGASCPPSCPTKKRLLCQHWLVSRVSSFIRQWSRVHQCFYFLDSSLQFIVG